MVLKLGLIFRFLCSDVHEIYTMFLAAVTILPSVIMFSRDCSVTMLV